jgi:hypothetical protein
MLYHLFVIMGSLSNTMLTMPVLLNQNLDYAYEVSFAKAKLRLCLRSEFC